MKIPSDAVFGSVLSDNRTRLSEILRLDLTFDIRLRTLQLAKGQGLLYYIDGFVKEEQYEKIIQNLKQNTAADPKEYSIPFAEVTATQNVGEAVEALLSGNALFLADGYPDALLLDTRLHQGREVSEPENDRVLRGARDGFVETLVINTALIRRRIRTPNLRLERLQIGRESRTDVVLCYMEGKVEEALLSRMRRRLKEIRVEGLNFGQESLSEALVNRRWYNPFPKVQYTERPDSASALLMEGKLLILCDNSPAAMVLPVGILDFMQESDDFYFPPLTATYLRLLRASVFFLTLFLTPVWYLLLQYPLPGWLQVLAVEGDYILPFLLQLYLVELAIDGLKLASLNTPSMLNNSLSIIGGLILGDLAVDIGLFAPQVIFYMAFVAIGNFSQPNYELGYAFKFMRMILLLLVALFHLWGLIAGTVLILILVLTNRTVDGRFRYLYPILPFDSKALFHVFFRPKL